MPRGCSAARFTGLENPVHTNGVATFDDTNAPLHPHRFYKGVTP